MRRQLKTFFIAVELIMAILCAAHFEILPEVKAQGTPMMTVEPSTYQAARLGEIFNITVNIYNIETTDKVTGVQFRVPYNASILEALNVTEGPFLQQFNNAASPPYTFFINFIEESPTYGPNVLVGILVLPNDTGYWTNFPFGSGALATITFKAIYRPVEPATATCPLNLVDTIIMSDDVSGVNHTTQGAMYEALPLPIPSLNIEPSTYDAALIGETFKINVDIKDIDSDWRLTGVQFRVPYNASILEALNVTEGPFLQQFNNAASPPYTFFINFIEESPTYGPNVLVGILVLPNDTGYWTNFPFGSGALATITFKAIMQTAEPQPPASCDLILQDTILINDTIGAIQHTLNNGHYEMTPLSFSYEPDVPRAGQPVLFEAPEADFAVTYCWNFGDGTSLNVTESGLGHIYALPGDYSASLTVVADSLTSSTVTEAITVLPNNKATIDATLDVGEIHFRGEIAEFSALIANYGEAVNATKIEAFLYYNGSLYADLTNFVQPVDTGFYRITYNIPVNAGTGRYTLVVKAIYYNANGICQAGFLVSPTLTNWDQSIAQITGISNGIATITTSLDTIKANLTDINARLISIEGGTATISSSIGTLQTSLSSINASITGLVVSNGAILAQINTIVGTLSTKLDTLNATVTQVKGDTATISTALGNVDTKLDGIQSTATTTLYAASIISAIAAILAALILILMLRKK